MFLIVVYMPYSIEFGYDILNHDVHWLVLLKYLEQFTFSNYLSYILFIVYEGIELQHKCIKWEFLNVWFVNSFIIVSSRNLRFHNTQVVFILRR